MLIPCFEIIIQNFCFLVMDGNFPFLDENPIKLFLNAHGRAFYNYRMYIKGTKFRESVW